MGRYRKLLVAIDGSETSTHALQEAFKLANEEKCWITVVSVVPAYEGDLALVGIGNVMHAIRRPCEDALQAATTLAQDEHALIKTECEEGVVYARITDLADAENCDLIVMGRRGSRHLERSLVGSVTARVIGHSHRDVLVVPKGTRLGWKKIVVATDGSRFSTPAMERAIDFAKSYGGDLIVVSVVDVPSEFYAESPKALDGMIQEAKAFVSNAKKQADGAGVKTGTVVREGEAFRVITDLARDTGADIIVMGSHGRTGLRRLLMGSVTEKVIGHTPCPVLVVKS